jgi:hypothetical protein
MKDYLENPRTTWLFSSPHQFYECFGELDHKYIQPANKGTRLGKDTFRIVLHFPNKHHNNREEYIEKMKNSANFGRYFNTPLGYSRIRWDSGSNPSAQLVLHDKKGRRVEFFLTGETNNPQGAAVFASTTFPTMSKKWKPLKANTKDKQAVKDKDGNMGKWIKSEKLVYCPVRVGSLNVSASRPGEWKLTKEKPTIQCGKGVTAQGHSPEAFQKKDKKKKVKLAETNQILLSAEELDTFYEAQGLPNLLEIQDVEIMDSETEQQGIERAYYNPSEAMVGTDETLDGYRPIDSATVDLTSNQPMANYGAEGKKRMMCAECGSYDVKAAEGETATYAPSEEPDMVSSSSFDEPTNAHFSAEGDGINVADVEASVEPANEPIAVAEGTSLDGYAPLDSIEEGAPIGHGVNQYFGSAETSFAMEGVEGALLDESTTNIGIEEGVSLDNFSGVDSVVVEAPLGHGVTQWFAEGEDGPSPQFDSGITGQDGPSDTPTNEYFALEEATRKKIFEKYGRKAFVEPDDLGWPIMNLEGNDRQAKSALWVANKPNIKPSTRTKVRKAVHKMWPNLALGSEQFAALGEPDAPFDQGYDDEEHESISARHGGSATHQQNLTDRSDEAWAMTKKDGGRKYSNVGTMDAETNRWHNKRNGQFTGRWSKHRRDGTFRELGADTAGYLQDGSLSMDGYTPLESVDVDRTSYQPTQNYGADEIFGDKPGTYMGKATYGALAGVTLFTASMAALYAIGSMLTGNKSE